MTDAKNVTMPVTGMTCSNCAATIERNVRKLAGVNVANVNLASEKLTVTFNPALMDEKGIIARVEHIGYGVATGKTELPLTGLKDQSDALLLEKLLGAQNGVLAAGVNYGTERVMLEYIPGMTSIAELGAVIRKAGYDLVKVGESEELEDVEARVRSNEVQRQKRLLILGLIFTVPLVVYSMARDFGLVSFPYDQYAMFLAATVVQFGVGWQYYVGAFKSLRAGGANMDVLIALGSSVAYFYSVGVTFGLIGRLMVYYESGAAIITLIMLGKFLEARAKGKTSEALKALIGLRAKVAHVLKDGMETDVDIEQVVVGDVLVVRPGEKVPVDGIISEGRSAMDESMITGESMPVSKGPGNEVIGATINKEGLIKFEATKVGRNTALAQIVRLVQEAQGSKAPIQKLADRVSAYFVPAVIGIAVLTFAGWLLIGGVDWSEAMINAVAVVVIACPCALGLATPTAIMVGTTRGAENGILFKNSEALERAGRLRVVVLDKTGTLTRGEPTLTDLVSTSEMTHDELLSLAASAERGSEHPLGRAIVAEAANRNLQTSAPEQFSAVSGFGIRATVEGQTVIIGSPRLMQNEGIPIGAVEKDIERLQGEGKTVMVIAVGNPGEPGTVHIAGLAAVADTLKPGSAEAISDLQNLGLELVMITGDNQRTADAIARQAGITRVLAEVLPGDKALQVKNLQEHQIVAMVGDGINDAPALAQADVGIALGTGTDVAMAAAGITLISGDLRGVGRAISLSRGTMQTIVQNLFWAFFYNIFLIPIASFGLLIPMVAAGAMAFSSIFVVTNSLRLRGYKVQKLARPKSLPRQIGELAPRLLVSAGALGVLIAVSVGWLKPAGMMPASAMQQTRIYRTAIRRTSVGQPTRLEVTINGRIVAGSPAGLDIKAYNPNGGRFTDFDNSVQGRDVIIAAVPRDLSSLTIASLIPGVESNTTSSEMTMSSGGAPAALQGDGSIRPKIIFPGEGQYTLFVDFWTRASGEVVSSIPLRVGTDNTPTVNLTPDASLTKTVADLRVRLIPGGALIANQYIYFSFEATDALGVNQSNNIQVMSRDYLQLYVVDEQLTSFIRPDFVNRHKLQYSVYFPKPGIYKLWLSFLYPDKKQVEYVVEVK